MPRPRPNDSFRKRAANAETGRGSSRDPMDAPPCRDEVSDATDADIVVWAPDADGARVIGNATFCKRGLPPVRDPVRVWVKGGTTKRSAIDWGGERGRDVRVGKLPGDPEMESLC